MFLPFSNSFNLTRRALCLSLFALSANLSAQTYPNKPVTIVVPYNAGGDADQSARNLGTVAQNVLKQPVVILNKGGASGAIGSQFVKDAAPDGYTLLLARVGSQAVLPAMKSDLSYKWNDFTFIGLLELNPVVCVVHPDSPYKTFGDLTKAIADKPGKLNYSSSGPGTILNFAPQLMLQTLKLNSDAAVNISYKGGSEAVVAVLAREVDFSCGNLTSALTQITAGKLRALVTTTPERVKDIPNVPTAKEAGMPQLEAIVGWSALYGPPKLSQDVINQWVNVLNIADKDANWQAGNVRYGGIPRILSPMDTEKFAASQYVSYSKLSTQLGIK
ncbi:MAG: ABC transporter substrate-binding protein [Polynucleobacter sp. 35-46-11]|uniref:Bug family tripartite tricarboxylate transporter substrate binding protein n=1 Tax=Polynucleobacter sp. 35-46-11 TaxID=1970425 RepID=UPI000BCBA38A|nr:tripartite tricarboxylate transporter substrate binding protein [Polynucleobacter sp. 35-46-11]OYY14290.1 MAG: ABC transporter substrate-binding protein [Polynucleobacter sp. 35-46-11]